MVEFWQLTTKEFFMFKVLSAPFDDNVKGLTPNANFSLVYESQKGIRVLISDIGRVDESESLSRNLQHFETTAEWLNAAPSFEAVKEMLRSIIYTYTQGEKDRRAASTAMSFRPKPFYPSFRGHGGSGVDGYW